MNDNSDIIQVCPAIEQRFNASGNSGNLSVTAGQQYLLHEVCFEVDTLISETIQIRTGAVQSSASITVGGNPNIVNLDVLDLVVDGSECIVLLPPPGPRAVVENGVPYFSDDRGFLLKGQDGNCYLIYIDGNGELIHEIRECPQ
jgi:hypothetical protein